MIFFGIVIAGFACQVPVFRFALERWERDSYTLVIVPGASGKLSPAENEVRKILESGGGSDLGNLNLEVRLDPQKIGESSAATMQLFYPPRSTGPWLPPIWSGALTMANTKTLVDSSARREIVNRLLSGESVVWVLIESGNKEKDDRAAREIEKAFAKAEAELKIPDGVLTVAEARKVSAGNERDPDATLRSSIPLKIKFSLMRIARANSEESIFREMLLHMEADLGEFRNDPMVFPVFGRGRALEPLIARGINLTNVFEHSAYFCGACSCEIKNQNPGVDLLISANWEDAIAGNEVVVEKSLPPLLGIGILSDKSIDGEKIRETLGSESTDLISRPWVMVVGVILLMLAFGSVLILRNKR
ncbi:hypothetical protein N8461_00905 [Akkermansiaceae bacterium]|nr:hypothetical protein [Akkermansiaceae bacterium]MDA7504507.1 hypothetical protein [Akkermansiaceae bacterium]